MLPEDFWLKVGLHCDSNRNLARGLSTALRDFFKYKVQLLLTECLIAWLTVEGRAPRPTRRTSRLFWLRRELILKVGWTKDAITAKKGNLREGRKKVSDLLRLYFVSKLQHGNAQVTDSGNVFSDIVWWRLRWCLWRELANPFVVEDNRKREAERVEREALQVGGGSSNSRSSSNAELAISGGHVRAAAIATLRHSGQ